MSFLISTDKPIDKNKTKKIVEKYLYVYSEISKKLWIADTSTKQDKVLNSEISFCNQCIKVSDFIKVFDDCLSSLNEIQRRLIIEKYFKNDGQDYDYIVKENLQLAERTYYRIKLNALLKLADNLNLVILQ